MENITHNLENYKDNLKVLHLNCRSLNGKRTELKVFGVLATWFDDSNDEKLWMVDSSKFVHFRLDLPKTATS